MKSGRIIIFFAELKERREGLKSNEGRLEWFKMDELLDNMLQMPFTAYYVVKHYLERGKNTNALYAGIATESGVAFIEMNEF